MLFICFCASGVTTIIVCCGASLHSLRHNPSNRYDWIRSASESASCDNRVNPPIINGTSTLAKGKSLNSSRLIPSNAIRRSKSRVQFACAAFKDWPVAFITAFVLLNPLETYSLAQVRLASMGVFLTLLEGFSIVVGIVLNDYQTMGIIANYF